MLDNKITCEYLTEYLNKVLNSDTYKKVIASLEIKDVDYFYTNFANIISKYYISTMDNNLEHAEEICLELFNYDGEDFFEDILMDRIFSLCSKQLNLDNHNIENYYKICELIYIRNQKNAFFTHCFPGAIIDDVRENGLNIYNFRFPEEVMLLSKYFKTPFKIGALYYCELSEGSLSYSTSNTPESIRFFLGGLHRNNNEETNYELHMRSFLENLNKLKDNGIDHAEIEKLYEAGKKLIDFYCKTTKSGIAFFNGKEFDAKYKYNFNILNCADEFNYNSFLYKKIKEIINLMQSNPDNAFIIWNEEINKICQNNPDLQQEINGFIKKRFSYHLQNYVIRNYRYEGNADGYQIDNGVLSRDQIEILEVDVPRELHIKLRREKVPLIQRNLNDKHIESKDKNNKVKTICETIEKIATSENEVNSIFNISSDEISFVGYYTSDGFKIYNHFFIQHDNELYISQYSEKMLERIIIREWRDNYIKNGNPLDIIIENYKQTAEYDEETDKNEELKVIAATWFFKNNYYKLPPLEKMDLLYKKSLQYDSIRLINEHGIFYTEKESKRQMLEITTLYSKDIEAPYNSLFESIIESKKQRSI